MSRRRRDLSGAIAVYLIVLLSLQIFLLTVALDGLLADDERLAWVSAALSVTLTAGSYLFYRTLRP